MSKVVIQGDASGTGNFTIAAPNSNTDRTLTLPDEAGEVLVNGTTSKVGIGTSSPDANGLTISSAGGEMIHLISSHSTKTFIEAEAGSGSMWRLGTAESNPHVRLEAMYPTGVIKFFTNSAERMRVHSSGMVTVATNVANASDGGVVFNTNGNVTCGNSAGSSGHEFGTFRRSGSQIGSITQSGTTGVSYNTSSDYRLKENVVEITNGIDRVKLLNPSRFNFISDSDTTVDGFLAHEVQEVVPEAIAGAKDATKEEEYEVTPAVLDDDGNVVTEAVMGTRTVPDYQGIDQSKLVPLLTAALQEAITKIEALEARVTALENA